MKNLNNRLLVSDIGSTMTTVALIDRVNGRYRFVARGESLSTYGWPWSDVTVGIRAAARQIEQLLGCTCFRDDGTLIWPRTADGDGVDNFVAVSSITSPVRTVLVGLTRDMSLRSGYRALASVAGLQLMASLAFDDGLERRDPNAWLAALQRARPELVLIVGGCDDGAVQPMIDIIQTVALYNRLQPPAERALVCYAGNAQLAEAAAQAFAGLGELRILPNVRPSPETENIGQAALSIETLCWERRLMQVPGMLHVAEWTGGVVVPTARSFGQLIHYVGQRYALNVIGFDVGSSQTTMAYYYGRALDAVHGHWSIDDTIHLTVRADLGIGWAIPVALQHVELERIARWLPEEVNAERIQEILLNKSLYPQSVPAEPTELFVEHALAREVMRETLGDRSNLAPTAMWDLIIGSGRTLTRTPMPGYAALLLLDALEPVGITKLALDVGNIGAALGAVAMRNPLAAADLVEHDAFLTLGTLVATSGYVSPEEIAVRVRLECRDGRAVQGEVPGGTVRVIPLPAYQSGTLMLYPIRKVDVGVGRAGTSAVVEAEGGTLGILVDTRGRPLALPTEVLARCQLIQRWLDNVSHKGDSPVRSQIASEKILRAA